MVLCTICYHSCGLETHYNGQMTGLVFALLCLQLFYNRKGPVIVAITSLATSNVHILTHQALRRSKKCRNCQMCKPLALNGGGVRPRFPKIFFKACCWPLKADFLVKIEMYRRGGEEGGSQYLGLGFPLPLVIFLLEP